MGQPSTQDFTAPFDPTAYTQIDGAQLLQYLQGAYPGTDVGLVVTTTGTIAAPTVPDAVTNTKWQRYLWQMIYTDTNSITLFVWNPNQASPLGPTYQNWNPAFSAAIGAGTIQGYQIAANTITDGNIANVNWSKITNAPTSLPPSGAAGPTVLSGTYPDPSIKNGGITSAMIAQNAITGGATGKLATGANGATLGDNLAPTAGSNLGNPSGGAVALAANDRVVVNAAKTGYCTVQKVIDALAEPAVGDALKVVQVNSGGTGFQYSTAATNRILQQVVFQSTAGQSTVTNLAITGVTPTNANTTLCTLFGVAGTMTFTPLSAASRVRIKVNLQMYSSNANSACHAHLFNNATPIASGLGTSAGAGTPANVSFFYDFAPGATTAIPFLVYFAGVGGTTCINETNTPTAFFNGGLSNSSVEITEYL